MPQLGVELPLGLSGTTKQPRLRERVVNYFRTETGLVTRPGISDYGTGTGAVRGSFIFDGQVHQVSGNKLIKITPSVSEIGTIAGSAAVSVAVDHAKAAIVVKGGNGYEFDGTTITEIEENYFPSDSVVAIDGFFVYQPSDGSELFNSELAQPGTILGDAFFDAESLPDLNTGVFRFRNELIAGGANSIEIFRHTGPDTQPFVRVLSGQLPYGYYGGGIPYKTTFGFVGRDQDGGPGIFTPEGRLSTPAVDEIILTYDEDGLSDVRTMRFQWNGADAVMFRFASHCLCFAGGWFEFTTGADGLPWTPGSMDFHGGKYLVGDMTSARIGQLADVSTDYGSKFERSFETFVRESPDAVFSASNLELAATPSSDELGSIGLSLSRDGLTYGPVFWREIPRYGSYSRRLTWNYQGGLGQFDSYMGIKIRTTARVDFGVGGLFVDVN